MKKLVGLITAALILGLSAGVATGLYAAMKRLPITNYFAPTNVNAVWDWRNPATQNLETLKGQAEQLRLMLQRAGIKSVQDLQREYSRLGLRDGRRALHR